MGGMTPPAPRSTRRHPKIAIALIVVAVLLIAAIVIQTRFSSSSGPTQAGMTLGAVRSSEPQSGGTLKLTVGYTVAGTSRTVTDDVDSAAYTAQGRTVWVCFDTSDPGQAHLRLPMDDLCS